MKRTLFTLLAAFVASPVFAVNLLDDVNNWTPICDNHAHNFTLENGNLVALGGGPINGGDGCWLLYTSTAYKMENGSSLAITLQFDGSPVTASGSYSSLIVLPQGTNTELHFLEVKKLNKGSIELQDTMGGALYSLSEGDATTAILTLNYTVEDGDLCYTYTFNGETSEKKTAAERIDTNSAWQPSLLWDWDNPTAFTVTDVTFSTSSPMVPEPTTATLSLLALAGLAVRRRRK